MDAQQAPRRSAHAGPLAVRALGAVAANPGAKKVIEDYLAASPPQDGHIGSPKQIRPSADFADVKAAAQAVTKLISVSLDPEGTENHLNAAVRDIVQKAERKAQAGRTAEREVVRV